MAAKNAEFVLNRDFTLTTIFGHSVEFKKGVPVRVPPIIQADARAIGAVPVGDSEGVDLVPEAKADPVPDADRAVLILQAIEQIVEKDDRDDFTATGKPTTGAVSAIVGFKVSSQDLTPIWAKFRADNPAE